MMKQSRRLLCRLVRLSYRVGDTKIGAMSDQLIRYGGAFSAGIARSASGSFYELDDGRRVLDFTAGQICATIGHNHPRVVAAIERACRDVLHLNSWVLSEPVLRLAQRLLATLPPPLERVLFLSTGGAPAGPVAPLNSRL
jgi:2,2-dialkylglycine decarboxylase (pyruvate)